MHWLDELNEELAEKIVAKPKKLSKRAEDRLDRLRNLENELFEKSLLVVGSTCDFAELDPVDPDKIPEKWIELYGEEEARKRHRVAMAGWQSVKTAPKAIDVALKVAVGIIRARATERGGVKQLNMNVIKMPMADMPVFEVMDVE